MTRAGTLRNIAMALLGVGGLLFKSAYHGPFHELVYAYGGNFSVSFALYFVALNAASRHGLGRLAAAAAVFLAVQAFEAADGFGVMENTYDPLDFAANGLGIGAAVITDILSSRLLNRQGGSGSPE